MFKDSAIILNAISQSFVTKSETAACLPHFPSILDSRLSRRLLALPFRLEIENIT
jgi:hypothetical protein